MGGEPGDLVAEALGGDDGHFFQDLLVGVEIQSHLRVVAFDHLPRRLLHRLRTDATHGCRGDSEEQEEFLAARVCGGRGEVETGEGV